MSSLRPLRSVWFILGLSLLLAPAGAWAGTSRSVTLSIGDALGNAGDAVEVPLTLETGGAAETMVLFIDYDPALVRPAEQFYEFVQTDLAGNPLRDEDGNVITTTSAVRAEAAVTDSGKLIQSTVQSEGYISIAIVGIGTGTLPAGLLCTIAFEIQPGVSTPDPILLDGDEVNSSASATGDTPAEPLDITVDFTDGSIETGCIPPLTPTGLTATSNRSDGVQLSWVGIAELDAEYRVFRNTQLDIANAVPLGEGWQAETSFFDVTALAPEMVPDPGCPRRLIPNNIRYYYWVRARSVDGCISEFSSPPVQGGRIDAKSMDDATAAAGLGSGLNGATLVYALLAAALIAARRRPRRTA